jgi:glycosyltransferase involved in cell wall biosynthesis
MRGTQTPLISILIPVYNCETWVGAAIASALAQTWSNKEVIVFDDGSTDRTPDVIRSFGSEIRVDRQRLGGQNFSRNRLTALSRGQWLVFLDADDELMPDNVAQKLAYADNTDVLYGSMEMARFAGPDKLSAHIETAVEYTDGWWAAFNWSFPNSSAMMFRRTALLDVGGWPTNVENCTDFALYFRLLLGNCRFRAVPEAVSLYRHWSSNQASYENRLRKLLTKTELLCWAGQELSQRGGFTPSRLEIWSARTLECVRLLYPHDSAKANKYFQCILDINPGYRPTPPRFSASYSLVFRCFGFRFAQWLADKSRNRRKAWAMAPEADSHPAMLAEK